MEDCTKIEDLLPLYLDEDELNNEEKTLVEAHLAVCPHCRAELQEMKESSTLLRHMGACVFQAPEDFSSKVMERVKAEGHTSRLLDFSSHRAASKDKNKNWFSQHRWAAGIAAAAALAVAIGGAEFSFTPTEPTVVAEKAEKPTTAAPAETVADPAANPAENTETAADPAAETPAAASNESTAAADTVTAPAADTPTADTNAASSEPAPEAPAAVNETVAEAEPAPSADTPSETATEAPITDSNLVLLNQDDNVRSTLLKMAYPDSEVGIGSLQEYIADAGGNIIDSTLSVDSKCKIFTIQVPRSNADHFIANVVSSGTVVSQEQDYKTTGYSQLMEEYLQIQAQLSSDPSEDLKVQLETQLAEVEEEMNAAEQDVENETIVLWVELSENN